MRIESLLLLAAIPATLPAQEATLRFRPAAGAQIHFVGETQLNIIVVGFPSLPDSTVIESSWRTVATQRVTEVRAADRLVIETLDSSRARSKIGDAPRSDIRIAGVEGLSALGRLTDRLHALAFARGRGGDSAFIDALGATAGGFALELPDGPVTVGGQWTTGFRFPLGAQLSATGKLTAFGSLIGRATATLDSLVPRSGDTLAYLTVRALADPSPLPLMAEDGTGTGTFSGGFAAAMVWSTGWNAIVSAVTNGRVVGTLRVERVEGPPVNGALSITITAKHQVRL